MKTINKLVLAVALLAFSAVVFAQSADVELAFYQKQSQSEDKKLLNTIVSDLDAWLVKNADDAKAEQALFLKANIETKMQNYSAAALTLLRYKYEFPTSAKQEAVLSLQETAIAKTEKKKQADLRSLFAAAQISGEMPERLSKFLAVATNLNLKNSYEFLQTEYLAFFTRFPSYDHKDKVELLLGDLYRQNGNFKAALMQYSKVYDIYPSPKYKAAALRMMGDIYAGELEDYNQALYYYEAVLKNFPNSVERATTYKHMAFLYDNKGEYEAAVNAITQAINIYLKNGQNLNAYNALLYRADLQEHKIKDYNAAVSTLNKTAALFAKDEAKFIETKTKAAAIYGGRLKDIYSQISAQEEIISAYPANKNTPQVMYNTGLLYEKAQNLLQARDLYQNLVVKHPASPYAAKAQRRLEYIDKTIIKLKAAGMAIPGEEQAKEAQKAKEAKAIKEAAKPVAQIDSGKTPAANIAATTATPPTLPEEAQEVEILSFEELNND